MDKWREFMNVKELRLINHLDKTRFNSVDYSALTSFAIDDALAISIGDNTSPITLRLWTHDETVVLGTPDSRTPFFEEGLDFLKSKNQHVVIRNSGGLAVALDSGVLNLSLIIPNNNKVSISRGYDIMTSLIRDTLKDYTQQIKAYEIVGSYCPGDYDLSINGIKFAGISQRRVKNGVSVQIYLDICGQSDYRANLIKDFYAISIKKSPTNLAYPDVNPAVMGSLSDILNISLSVNDVINRLNQLLDNNQILIQNNDLSKKELVDFHKRLEQMNKRNEKINK